MRGREPPGLDPIAHRAQRQNRAADPCLDQLADGGDRIDLQADLDRDVMRGRGLLDQHARAVWPARQDQGVAARGGQRDGLAETRRFPRRGQEIEILAQQGIGRDAFDRVRVVSEAEIDPAFVEPPHDVFAQTLDQLERDARIARAAFPHQPRRQQRARRRCDAERDLAAGRAGQIHQLLAGELDLAQRRVSVTQQRPARLGRVDAARMAVQQRDAELVLQLPDLEAERRLGDVNALGRTGEALGLDDLDEIAQLSDVHGEFSNLKP